MPPSRSRLPCGEQVPKPNPGSLIWPCRLPSFSPVASDLPQARSGTVADGGPLTARRHRRRTDSGPPPHRDPPRFTPRLRHTPLKISPKHRPNAAPTSDSPPLVIINMGLLRLSNPLTPFLPSLSFERCEAADAVTEWRENASGTKNCRLAPSIELSTSLCLIGNPLPRPGRFIPVK